MKEAFYYLPGKDKPDNLFFVRAQEYSLDESKPVNKRYKCRALYMGALFDVHPSRGFEKTLLYLGHMPIDHLHGVIFTVGEDSGCMDFSPPFHIERHGNDSVIDGNLLGRFVRSGATL